jgi:competence protein ComEA
LACVNGLVLASAPAFATVNVNTAQQSELQSTRGLDKYRAKAIIEYRNQYGPYLSVADLAKAIGPAVAGKVASQVAFDGPPYVPPPQPAKPARKKP